MKKTEWIFLVLGLGLFAYLVYRIGWLKILDQLDEVGWYFLLILVVSGARYWARTLAWKCALPPDPNHPSLAEMFRARVAGQALGYVAFAGPLLSEPAKAALLRRQLPLSLAFGSAVLEAGIYAVTSVFVMVVGLIPAGLRLTMGEDLRLVGILAIILFIALGVAGRWLMRQRVRFLTSLLNLVSRGPWRERIERRRPQLEQAERQLLDYYHRHTDRFRRIFLLDCLSHLFAMLEIYIILRTMDVAVGWVDILILEALSKLLATIFFFVPGRVGTEEGGLALVFELLNFGAARGVGLALVQRLRALVWTGLGMLLLLRFALRRDS